jgi:hypothetical protein
MVRKSLYISVLLAACALSACGRIQPPTADQQAAAQQEDLSRRAQSEIGIYQPTNFARKRLANRIGQMLDDPKLATISYAQGLDGRLRCIGHTIGFPLPFAVQTTSPQKWEPPPYFDSNGNPYNYGSFREGSQVPQSEPDQLYYPSGADATWVLLVNSKGETQPAYFEGHVETFLEGNKPVASLIEQDCE